ncbi:MAG: hypothetical protein DYG89_54745 [Caldilinea sp. CFX5]|nr:hypothetical protein [Caldilinea sp. CFX5]
MVAIGEDDALTNQRQPTVTAGTPDLLRTKLAPPRLHTSLLPRTLLLARLTEAVERKLTLLSAPAGFGKTTLVSQWVKQQDAGGRMQDEVEKVTLHPASFRLHPSCVAWLSLDENDNDPVRFWRYVITACQRFAPAVGVAALRLLQTAARPAWETVLTRLLNDLTEYTSQDAHWVLVLEDYHVIQAPSVHETLTFFLDHLPAPFHVIITTRHDPPLPLAPMRARNELSELRALDLRFSQAETQLFFQQALAAPLAPAAIAYLAERTEGWVAGLHLAALALQQRPQPAAMSHFLATFRGSHEHIFSYLVAEVLRAQSPAHQEFLLQTSVLSRLSGALCDAVTGRADSEAVLADLERANLFLLPFVEEQASRPLGNSAPAVTVAAGDRAWYRYHALFAEAMQQAARRQLGEEALRALSQKASRWYEAHGLRTEAIETALTAQDWRRAATLIAGTTDPMNPSNEYHTLRRWIDLMPADVLRAQPALAFLYAVAILFTSERRSPATMALVQAPLQMAEEEWSAAGETHNLGAVLALRALLAWLQGRLSDAFAAAQAALARLPATEKQWRGVVLIFVGVADLQAGRLAAAAQNLTTARALCERTGNEFGKLDAALNLGEVYTQQGELRQAAQLYHYVLSAAEDAQMEQEQARIRVGNALIGLSALAYEGNALADAEQQALQALAIGEQVAYTDLQIRANLLLAQVEQARGATVAAQQRLHTLVARIAEPRWAALLRRVHAQQAQLALATGDQVAVEQWATTVTPQDAQEQEQLLCVRWWIASGQTDAALSWLAPRQAEANDQGRIGAGLAMRLLQSLAWKRTGCLTQAQQSLLTALRLAQPKGYQRLFLDEGEWLMGLLLGLLPTLTEEPLRAYSQELLAAFGVAGEQAAVASQPPVSQRQEKRLAGLIEPLSDREEDVLRLIAAGLATDEVARELVITVGTVRTHLKHIYGKLDAHNRVQAVERARALQLL